MTALLLAMGLLFGAAQETSPKMITVETTACVVDYPFKDGYVVDRYEFKIYPYQYENR